MRTQISNKAFKSDSQRLALSLRSSIAKRCSHLNAALGKVSFYQLKRVEIELEPFVIWLTTH
ncbi:hypothetical protein DD758_16740 [Vibrio anguillarum]|nr:hypothetical protein DD758_16740 [Vibrio anguillarum]